jgi:hypothetical protein
MILLQVYSHDMRLLAFSIALLAASVTFAEETSSSTHQSRYENVSEFGGPEAAGNQIRAQRAE